MKIILPIVLCIFLYPFAYATMKTCPNPEYYTQIIPFPFYNRIKDIDRCVIVEDTTLAIVGNSYACCPKDIDFQG